MPVAADFLRLILADPDADGPRLVFADWLDDQNQAARAEFIRVQCALASRPADDPQAPALRARAEVLLEEHRLEWGEPLAGVANRWEWVRGFPDVVRLNAKTFLARGEQLFAALPIRHVELLDVAVHLPKLARCPLLERLAALSIASSHAGNAIVNALGSSPHLDGLESLYLQRDGLTDWAVSTLAAGHVGNLTTLDLSHNGISPAGAHALAAATNFSGLTTLCLRGNPLGSEGVAAVLNSSRLANLARIDLGETHCTPPALQPTPPLSRQWTVLNLADNDIGDLGVEHLCRWPATGLRDLDLSRAGVGDAGAAALANSPHLGGLRRLVLNGNRITEEGKRLLLAAAHFQKLPALEMRGNG